MFGSKGGDKEVKYIFSKVFIFNFYAGRPGIVFNGRFPYMCGTSVFFL